MDGVVRAPLIVTALFEDGWLRCHHVQMADEFDEVIEGEAQELSDGEAHELSDGEGEGELRPHELRTITELRPLDRPGTPAVPARQAAALAATGFVAGAAAAALVRHRAARKLGRNRRLRARRSPQEQSVISTHTYLLRVQVLGRPAE
jgi:hypothetical protein